MIFALPNAYDPDARGFTSYYDAARFKMTAVVTCRQLAMCRHLAGITQRDLADLLGTTETTVSRLERGQTPIDTRWSSHLTLLFAHIIPLARSREYE